MRKKLVHALVVGLFATASVPAANHLFDFNSDPNVELTIYRGEEANSIGEAGRWFSTDGSPLEVGTDPSTNGYLQITKGDSTSPSAFGHRAVIVFPDFDAGLVIAGFTFQCDLRVGGGTQPPADGFSLNYARNSDPVIANADGSGFASSPGNEANLPEEGTQTGLAVCFDSWNSGSGDVVGITIRVDNVIQTNLAMPTVNGECNDPTSMQTGTNTLGLAGLCWQPLYVQLTTDGRLSIAWKGTTLITNYVVDFAPSPGRLIFAGRVGGSNQYQDVDNIRLDTIPSASPVVSGTIGNGNGFKFVISDSGPATPDTNTITLTLDGAPVTPSGILQSGTPGGGDGLTSVYYQNPAVVLAAGSVHTNIVEFSGSSFSGTVRATNVFTVPNYMVLNSADQAAGPVSTATPGFWGHINQLPVARYPGSSQVNLIEKQLANEILDPNTGLPYADQTLLGTSTFTESTVINWSQDVPMGGVGTGNFSQDRPYPYNTPDQPIPGVDAQYEPNTDWVAAEVFTVLYLPAGAYEFGVNHDDGYKLSFGPEPRNFFDARVLASKDNNADDTGLRVVVTDSGYYPVRLLWGENGGGAQLEFYFVDFATGNKILVNDLTTGPTAIAAYQDPAALTRPYVVSVAPRTGAYYAIEENGPITVKFQDGSAGSVVDASIRIDGQTPIISNSGNLTTATLSGSALPPGIHTATLVYQTTLGGPFTNTWQFNVFSSKTNVVQAGDPIAAYQPNGGSSPGAESVENAIGHNQQKYLNFGNGSTPMNYPLGFTVTPAVGSTIVTGLRHYSANDAPERDPAYVVLEGSLDDGASWHPIFSGPITMDIGRNGGGAAPLSPATNFVSEVSFPNTLGFTSYRWYTTALRGNVSLMQIAEVELLGATGTPAPLLSITRSGSDVILTPNQPGTLESSSSATGGWTVVGPISAPQTIPASAAAAFYRLRVP